MRLKYIVFVAAVALMPAAALASRDEFTCSTERLFGTSPCGQPSYTVPDGQSIKFNLYQVDENSDIQVKVIDARAPDSGVLILISKPVKVSPGTETILWSNHTGTDFKISLEINNDDWGKVFSKGTVTGAIIIE